MKADCIPRPGLEIQEIRSTSRVSGSGLRYVAVPTEGNQSSSPEEADRVRDLVSDILASGTTWVDKHGVELPITLQDILIIAPYNAQVFELQDRISGSAHWDGRQVSGAGSSNRHLFDDDFELCGRAPRDGVSL